MYIIGITGGVATGKSTVAKILQRQGYAVFDADLEVAKLYQNDLFAQRICLSFPEAVRSDGTLDKRILAEKIFSDIEKRQWLEDYIHPLIFQKAWEFQHTQQRLRNKIIFWDVPLLLSSGMGSYCDRIWVTFCPERLQRYRVLKRPGWDEKRWRTVKRAQLPVSLQVRCADAVIPTGLGRATTFRSIKRALLRLHVSSKK